MSYLFFSRVPSHAFSFKNINYKDAYILTDERFYDGYKKDGFTNVWGFVKYLNNDSILTTAINLVEKHNIKLVHVMDESDIERAAMVRQLFQLPGQKMLSAQLYRDKYLMKYLLQDIVKLPNFTLIENKQDVIHFIQCNGLPIVLKPRKGWASNHMHKIIAVSQIDDITDFSGYLAESWIDKSKMYTVDGIQIDGEIKWYAIHEYDKNILESIENNQDGFAMLTSPKMFDQDFRTKVKEYTNKILRRLNANENFTSAFHLEFFYTNGEFIFCEIGSRLGGGKTMDLIKETYDIDLPKLLLDTLNKENTHITLAELPKQYAACYKKYYFQGNSQPFLKELSSKKWLVSFINNKPKELKSKPSSINDFQQLFVITANTHKEILERIEILESAKSFSKA